jgi:VIT1/CCC1 family predicted Fe2+/Mn2+ transporter
LKLQSADNIIARHRANGRYISPSVDNFARVLFALFGGLFLLVPMIAMAYITSKKYLLITAVLFVFVFALSLGYFSKGSNQELVGATAAYAAVLVVFVGNSITSGQQS